MKRYKVVIPYKDSKLNKKYEVEYIIDAENKAIAREVAVKKFDSYEENNFASWVREICEEDIIIEEVI